MDAVLAFLLKYPPRVWERGTLVWGPAIPPWALAVLAVAGVVAAVVAARRLRNVRTLDRVLLGGLRVAALLIVAAMLARPMLVVSTAVPQRNVLAVLLDDSRSMTLRDLGEQTRAEAVQGTFGDSAALVQALGERFSLRFYRFAADVRPAAGAASLTASGTRSDLVAALNGAREELGGLPLAGIVLVSDGADNGGADIEPALLGLRARRVPVHTVGVGLERFPRDVAIERLNIPARPLAGAALLADVTLRLRGVGGERVTVVAEANGRRVGETTVTLPSREEIVRVQVALDPLPPGVHRVAVKVSELPRETVAQNNEAQGVVQVRGGPDRILYIEGEPRPELAFMRRALSGDSAVELVTLLRSAERKFLRLGVRDSLELAGGFPTTREELFRFRGIILGSIEAAFFTADQLRMLGDFVSQRGGGLLALGGRNAFAEGGFRGTPVAEVLPIALDRATLGDDAPATEHRLRPTVAGRTQSFLRLGASDTASAQRWDSLPPLTVVNGLGSLRPGATALLTGRREGSIDDVPLLASQRFGRGTAYVFGVQDAWLWRMHVDMPVDDRTLETFWRQLIRTVSEESSDRLEVAAVPAIAAPGEPMTLRARLADEQFADVNDAAVEVTVQAPDGQVRTVPLEWTLGRDGVYEGQFVPEVAGLHTLNAEARRGRDTTRAVESALLADDTAADVEQAELRTPFLRRIAEQTGARYYPLAEAGRLAEDVMYTEAGVTMRESLDLWDMPLLFLLLTALLGAEWARRRARGLA
ncbi:MAG: hypothetical protein KF709_09910 [Gemmatimonadaceae bacterium]|nr:hypothetical protein [Gemmatimonadaceae bacterium]